MNSRSKFHSYHLVLLALAILALLAAIWAGWVRLGWHWPVPEAGFTLIHGTLMVSAFLGTLIALERAVALGQRWMYVGPLLTGLAGISLILGLDTTIGAILIALGSLGFVGTPPIRMCYALVPQTGSTCLLR
jgi:hypothetical protein